ncbi:hypothetical protein [Kitasatospora sp. CB01950]|uniref:hypothetical protein n=1 Tax=Kitasatospora sp. CB01950 TaxID=1703930 RepID=UPI00093F3F18|nr:hypothetical protein [Kitasatospora sp. CB01950]OKI95112.1 hypothetical protein AMK19_33145 [Kitasatospora sp. CB01950]
MAENVGAGEPDEAHRRPPGVDDATVEALGMLTKALEYTERARGHLYAVHHMTGGADRMLAEAVRMLRQAGHGDQADLVEREILGRDVVPGMWTYQLVEAYDETYYQVFTAVEEQVREDLAAGRRHLAEAEMQQTARSRRRNASP